MELDSAELKKANGASKLLLEQILLKRERERERAEPKLACNKSMQTKEFLLTFVLSASFGETMIF